MSDTEDITETITADYHKLSANHKNDTILKRYQESIIPAVKLDFEMFLEKFEALKDFEFKSFAKIWQNTNFTNIYADQQYVATLKILCSICYTTVKKYIVFQNSIYIRLGAFYLLYALYYKCPVQGLVKIRVTLEEYKKIKELMQEMIKQKQYEPVFAFAKLKADNAFYYVAQYKTYTIEQMNASKHHKALGRDNTFKEKEASTSLTQFKDLCSSKFIDDMDAVFKEYDTILKDNAAEFPTIDQFESTIIKSLKDSYNEIFHEFKLLEDIEPKVKTTVEESRRISKQKTTKTKKQTKKNEHLEDSDLSEVDI